MNLGLISNLDEACTVIIQRKWRSNDALPNILIKETIESIIRLKTMLRYCVIWAVLYGYFIAFLLENEVLANNNFEKTGKSANLSKLANYMLKCFDHFDKKVMGFNMVMPSDKTFNNVICKKTDSKNMISKYLQQINYLTNLIENYQVVKPQMKSNSCQRINLEPKHTVNSCQSKPASDMNSVGNMNLTLFPESAPKIKNEFISFSEWQNNKNKNKMIENSLNAKTMSATATPLVKKLNSPELEHYNPFYERLTFKQPTPHINNLFMEPNKGVVKQNNYTNDNEIGKINRTDREVYLPNQVLPTRSKQILCQKYPSFTNQNLLKFSSNLSSNSLLNDQQLFAPNLVTEFSNDKSNLSNFAPLPEFLSNSEKNKLL